MIARALGALHRCAYLAYPREFRAHFGAELSDIFERRIAQARAMARPRFDMRYTRRRLSSMGAPSISSRKPSSTRRASARYSVPVRKGNRPFSRASTASMMA